MEDQGTEEGIFEIIDFTNATEWESFISAIENVFHQWCLAASDQHLDDTVGAAKQHQKSEQVSYCGRNFIISLEVGGAELFDYAQASEGNKSSWTAAMTELLDSRTDFPPKAHHLSRWYGLSKFVLVAPAEGETALTSQAQAKLMLSSVSMAITNTGCVTPVFVQIHHKWRQMYVGVCEDGDVRMNFDMVHLRHTPAHYGHISGLLDLFKAKLRCDLAMLDPVRVAIRYTYVLNHWSLDDWPVESLDPDEREGGMGQLNTLPLGAVSDPVQEIHLSAVWPNLSEELVVDSETHSDLKPTHAPLWTVICKLCDNPNCLLSEQLVGFQGVCYRHETINDLLEKKVAQDSNTTGITKQGFSQALNRLTTPPVANMASPFIDSVVNSASQRLEQGAVLVEVLPDKELETVLKCLFPDAYDEDTSPFITVPPPTSTLTTGSRQDLLVGKLKSAPLNSLTFLLANSLCIVNNHYGLKALALIWFEVVQELRYRWENGIPLTNLPEGHPDTGCCLLHQKLQMLNCCILHKLSYDCKLHTPNVHSNNASRHSSPRTTDTHSKKQRLDDDVSLEFLTPNSSIHFSNSKSVSTSAQDYKLKEQTMTWDLSHDQNSVTPTKSNSDSDEFYEALETHDINISDDDISHTKVDRTDTESNPLSEQEMVDPSSQTVSKPTRVSDDEEPDRMDVSGNYEESLAVKDLTDIQEPGKEEGVRIERVGALKPCGDLILVATGELMYIPVTQEHTPMTEDMLMEQANILSRLGTSEEAAKVRAKMQSSSIVSDMQSFKAANPGCLLEDFVRWYSPRDWIEDSESSHDTSGKAIPTVDRQELSSREEVKVETEGKDSSNISKIMEKDNISTSENAQSHVFHGAQEMPVESDVTNRTADPHELNRLAISGGIDADQGEGGIDSSPREGWEEDDWDVIESDGDGEAVITTVMDKEDPPLRKQYVMGTLSPRMLLPDNIWVEAWNTSTPLPAYRQKRLFDDTREAEKLLHFLAGLSPAGIALQLMPVLLHSAITVVQERQKKHPLATVGSLLQDTIALLATVQQPSLDYLPMYQECISLLTQAEHLLAAAHSLRTKLNQGLELSGKTEGMISSSSKGETRRDEFEVSTELMLASPELVLKDATNSVTGVALTGLLAAQAAIGDLAVVAESKMETGDRSESSYSTETFPCPSGKEYILRAIVSRPSPHSIPSPQRMFCVLTSEEFRLAGAFGCDTKLI